MIVVGSLDKEKIIFEEKYTQYGEPLYKFKNQNYTYEGLIRISPYYNGGLLLKTKISNK